MEQNNNKPKQNFDENQSMDTGVELLKRVIHTNEENINVIVHLKGSVEDLVNIVGELESTMRLTNYNFRIFENKKETFLEQLKQIIGTVPKSIDAHLSEQSVSKIDEFYERLDAFEKKTRLYQKFTITTISTIFFICYSDYFIFLLFKAIV